jgi:hypothetical protein
MSAFTDLLDFLSYQTRRPASFLVFIGSAIAIVASTYANEKTQSQWLIFTGLGLIGMGTSMMMLNYLQQTRFRSSADHNVSRMELYDIRQELERLSTQTKNVANFTPEERTEIIADVTENLSQETAAKIASIWAKEFDEKSTDEKHESAFREIAENLVERLQEEISALGRRANVNLVIGILVSGLGLAVLTWFVISATSELSSGLHPEDAAMRFAVRLTLAIFIQVFAYFFLRLYRYSIFEIKYFQNEITGAQFKLLALVSAMRTKDTKIVDKLCLELAKTERNFVLKKGESTVALQREGIERDYENRIFAMIEKIGSRAK